MSRFLEKLEFVKPADLVSGLKMLVSIPYAACLKKRENRCGWFAKNIMRPETMVIGFTNISEKRIPSRMWFMRLTKNP